MKINGIDINTGSGSSGTSGKSGSSGTSGINGGTGSSGSSGTSGINGGTGSSGSSGTSGKSGSSGTSGINGLSGGTGTSGTSGINGTSITNEGYSMIIPTSNYDNNSTLAASEAITPFFFSVTASNHYVIIIDLTYSCESASADSDIRFDFNLSSGSMYGGGTVQHLNQSNAVANSGIVANGPSLTSTNIINMGANSNGGLDYPAFARIGYSFTPDTDATLYFRWGPVSAAQYSRIWAGSVFKYKELI